MISSNIGQVLLFFSLWLVLWSPIAVMLSKILNWQPFQPPTVAQKFPLVLSLYAIAPLALLGTLHWSHLSWAAYGLPLDSQFLWVVAIGFIIGALSLTGLFSLYLLMGWASFHPLSSHFPNAESHSSLSQNTFSSPIPPQPNNPRFTSFTTLIIGSYIGPILAIFGLSLVVGWAEELIFRGFLTYQLLQTLSPWQAGVTASAIFALLHLVWDGQESRPQLLGLWLMGIVLTVAWWVNQQTIYLAWGLHAGWVWFIALVDSFNLIHFSETVPSWLTGLDGKPLAGLMGILALIITGVLVGYCF